MLQGKLSTDSLEEWTKPTFYQLEASKILTISRLLGKRNRERPIAVCTNADVSHKLNLGNTQTKHANLNLRITCRNNRNVGMLLYIANMFQDWLRHSNAMLVSLEYIEVNTLDN